MDEVPEARLLPRSVEAPVAVPFIDDVVVFGVQPPCDLWMATERIQSAMVVPAPIHVAGAALIAPHVPELRVDHRLPRLTPWRLEIPGRSGKRAVTHALNTRFPFPARQVLVPRVDVRLCVTVAAARRVVFDEPRGIQRLRETVHARNLTSRLGE